MALVPARGIVRTLAAAGLGAVLLASVAAPVPAAPNDRGLEELWQEFPLDEEANAPVRGEERVSDESGDVSPPRARPASTSSTSRRECSPPWVAGPSWSAKSHRGVLSSVLTSRVYPLEAAGIVTARYGRLTCCCRCDMAAPGCGAVW